MYCKGKDSKKVVLCAIVIRGRYKLVRFLVA